MMIPLMAFFGVLLLAVGLLAIILRRRGQRIPSPSREEREVEQALGDAFGADTKWGVPGATELELHDHALSADSAPTD